MISYTQVFKTSLESSDMLAVISKAPYGMTESQENSATAAHLLLFKLPGNHAFLKPVKYCLTPTYNHLSL